MVRSAARLVLLGACVLWVAPGWAQGYPAKPVRIVVGFSAGSTTDLIGRVLAVKMGDGLGQPVVMDNRPGAGAYLRSETAKYAKVVKAIGLRIE